MSLEGPSGKERRMKKPLTAGARRYQEAFDRGDVAALKRMHEAAARTRAAKKAEGNAAPRREKQAPKDPFAAMREADALRDAELLFQQRVDAGEVYVDPKTGEVIERYIPPED